MPVQLHAHLVLAGGQLRRGGGRLTLIVVVHKHARPLGRGGDPQRRGQAHQLHRNRLAASVGRHHDLPHLAPIAGQAEGNGGIAFGDILDDNRRYAVRNAVDDHFRAGGLGQALERTGVDHEPLVHHHRTPPLDAHRHLDRTIAAARQLERVGGIGRQGRHEKRRLAQIHALVAHFRARRLALNENQRLFLLQLEMLLQERPFLAHGQVGVRRTISRSLDVEQMAPRRQIEQLQRSRPAHLAIHHDARAIRLRGDLHARRRARQRRQGHQAHNKAHKALRCFPQAHFLPPFCRASTSSSFALASAWRGSRSSGTRSHSTLSSASAVVQSFKLIARSARKHWSR